MGVFSPLHCFLLAPSLLTEIMTRKYNRKLGKIYEVMSFVRDMFEISSINSVFFISNEYPPFTRSGQNELITLEKDNEKR